MTHRHIFRMIYYKNIEQILVDGVICARNYKIQPGYQISYSHIVNKRNDEFSTPDGDSINDFVPFYFSPITVMAYTIHRGNVPLCDPKEKDVGIASMNDIIYLVSNTEYFDDPLQDIWFTDVSCNSATAPSYEKDLNRLPTHVDWPLFDEKPTVAKIPEIGYNGVHGTFRSLDRPSKYNNRKKKRGAEFLIKDQVPLNVIDCIIAKNDTINNIVSDWVRRSAHDIPVYTKSGCYF